MASPQPQRSPVYMPAAQLAAALRSGELSAVEVLEAHLAQIEAHNPVVNAVVTLDAERAREQAQRADRALARGELWGPLHGVPFTLKDCHATAGMRTTAGFEPLANYMPEKDGTVARRLREAGAILMGKTNVSTLLIDIQSNNPLFGRTNNPWHPDRTAGGSSGGAGAALAAGMTPFDIGSDIGGSIRIPSHFCGLFGLKPTENRVSLYGHIPGLPGVPRSVRITSSVGPMARSVEDLELLFELIAGPDGRDVEVPPLSRGETPQLALEELRLAFTTFPGFPLAAVAREALHDLVASLEPLSAAVEEALPLDLNYEIALQRSRRLTGMITETFAPTNHQPVSLPDYFTELAYRDHFINGWEAFFAEWDALLCPVSMGPAFAHCEMESPLLVDGSEVDYWWANAHCKLFNYSGHPAIVLPYTVDDEGLPIGVQLVGKRWEEKRLLAIARCLTQVTGEFRRPPGY
jgi:amidase